MEQNGELAKMQHRSRKWCQCAELMYFQRYENDKAARIWDCQYCRKWVSIGTEKGSVGRVNAYFYLQRYKKKGQGYQNIDRIGNTAETRASIGAEKGPVGRVNVAC